MAYARQIAPLVGAAVAAIASVPLTLLAATPTNPNNLTRGAVRALVNVIRAVPEVIIALVLLTVTGLTPFTGALALAIAGIGTQSKWVYETIESLRSDTAEAVEAAGGNRLATIRWALWPAAMPTLISFALYRFEINIRTSAVLGLVGAGGIGSMLSNYTNYRQWETVGMLLIVGIVATMIIDGVSGALRRRIMEGPVARGVGRKR
nr:phosphate/phosphonate ABC transporter permease [Microbacterium amylolyticum]